MVNVSIHEDLASVVEFEPFYREFIRYKEDRVMSKVTIEHLDRKIIIEDAIKVNVEIVGEIFQILVDDSEWIACQDDTINLKDLKIDFDIPREVLQ